MEWRPISPNSTASDRPPAPLDYVTHTTCPNVHAADDRSVMETLEALPYQITSTRAFMGEHMAYRIGPSQLGCRENPYGKATTPNPDNERLCLSVIDPRQRGLFNAAWSLAYAAACAKGGIEVVSLGAPTGPFGHIYRRTDFAQPYFDDLDRARGLSVVPRARRSCQTCRRLAAVRETVAAGQDRGAGRTHGRKDHLWLANLTNDRIMAKVPALDGAKACIAILDADSFERLTLEPEYLDAAAQDTTSGEVGLDAYATARIVIG